MHRSHSQSNLGLFDHPKDKEIFNKLILIRAEAAILTLGP